MPNQIRHSNQPNLEDGGDGLISLGWRLSRAQATMRRKKGRKRKKKKSKRRQAQEEEEDSTMEKPETRGTEPNIWFEGRHHEAMKARQAARNQYTVEGSEKPEEETEVAADRKSQTKRLAQARLCLMRSWSQWRSIQQHRAQCQSQGTH